MTCEQQVCTCCDCCNCQEELEEKGFDNDDLCESEDEWSYYLDESDNCSDESEYEDEDSYGSAESSEEYEEYDECDDATDAACQGDCSTLASDYPPTTIDCPNEPQCCWHNKFIF